MKNFFFHICTNYTAKLFWAGIIHFLFIMTSVLCNSVSANRNVGSIEQSPRPHEIIEKIFNIKAQKIQSVKKNQ